MKLLKSSTAIMGATAFLFITGCVRPSTIAATNTANQQAASVPVAAERTTLEGKWDYTMSNPDQDPFSGVLMVQRGGSAGYTGWISVSTIDYEAQTKVTKAEIQGEKFTYIGEVQTRMGSYGFEMTGTIRGNKMTGQNKVRTDSGPVVFSVTATRK
ncbi:hypothetical protein AAE02nite_11180 [Adhaeribacter aerolatus]|uniref:Lipocalin-like domain-containing protein n=1 Tax=Adhaeribacter aerolatus TaxID=670289 RepID=A0A512AUR5_9BACT|nr:hypothetical protein [Adhaeribacter aerolatus]GEO03454.1 hypothetical protein AAE02nite_11180 [Adhaeribacter aerolatus]